MRLEFGFQITQAACVCERQRLEKTPDDVALPGRQRHIERQTVRQGIKRDNSEVRDHGGVY